MPETIEIGVNPKPAIENNVMENVLNNTIKQVTKGELDWPAVLTLKDDHEKLLKEHSALKRKSKRIEPVKKFTSKECSAKISQVAVSKVFKMLNGFDIPFLKWDNPHPNVEAIPENYKPDGECLELILQGISMNLNTWIYGPPGCGKDAAINYVSAKTGLPINRISCDADISRSELIGRDKLEGDGKGGTQSTLIEGILIKALKEPCILVLDEIDFMREDVAYVLQTVLNEGKLTLLENGGEVIHRHPMCHVIATANTNGRCDPFNLYPGSRQQSAAFLDRFNHWVEMGYMDDYKPLIRTITNLSDNLCFKFNAFIRGYHSKFLNGDIQTPLSNRSIITICEKLAATGTRAFKPAIASTLLNRMEDDEKPIIEELMNKRLGIDSRKLAGI